MSDPIQIGDFRIERQIGAGGMGIVYLATQVSLNRKVALKVLGQSLTRQSDKQRFQREAQAVAKLNHPNIAKVHYVGQDDRLCYMAMEHIDGVSLRDCIERLARTTKPDSSIDDFVALSIVEPKFERFDETEQLSPTADYSPDEGEKATVNPYRSPQAEESITSERYIRRCVEIVRDVANALQHAHDQGVIHRDLKPDNLMLDKDGNVHIIDFGVAKFFEDTTMTQTGALVGTPIYMSPEQVTGRIELDARTDIYSLGIVLYELLVLRQPITATSRDGVLRNIVVKPLQPVSAMNHRVLPPLQNIIHKATAKDPDDRYQASTEFAEDLDRFLSGEDVRAPRYRIALDASELKGQRPAIVLVIGFVMFFTSAYFFVACVDAGIAMVSATEPIIYAIAVSATLCLGLWTMVNGWGYVTGRRWGKFNTSVTLLLAGAFLLVLGAAGLVRGRIDLLLSILFFLPGSVAVYLAFVPFCKKNVKNWFDFARRIRI